MDPVGTRRWWNGRGWGGQTQAVIAPKAPRPRVLASIPMRIAARSVDFLLIMVLANALNRVWAPRLIDRGFDSGGWLDFNDIFLGDAPPMVLFVTVIIVIVWEVFWLLSEGATPGKQLLGMYVADPSSARGTVEIVPALKRSAHRVIAIVPYGWLIVAAISIGSLGLMAGDRLGRQSLLDRFASTTVHRLAPGSPRFTPWFRVWFIAVVLLRLLGSVLN